MQVENISDGDLETRIWSPNRKRRLARCGPVRRLKTPAGNTVELNRLQRSMNGRAVLGRERRVRMYDALGVTLGQW